MEEEDSSNVRNGGIDNNNNNNKNKGRIVRGLPPTSSAQKKREESVVEPSIVYRVSTSVNDNHRSHRRRPPIRIVCISDTHNHHRNIIDMPPSADLLIHAGDFTAYGKLEHVIDFNIWLGELPYRHKIVVNGNHEYEAKWKHKTKSLLSNAIFLKNQTIQLHFSNTSNNPPPQENEQEDPNGGQEHPPKEGTDDASTTTTTTTLTIHGTDFFWPALDASQTNDCLDKIPTNKYSSKEKEQQQQLDILISHCPAKSFVDCGRGCPALARKILLPHNGDLDREKQRQQQQQQQQPLARIVISGHEHDGRGIVEVDSRSSHPMGGGADDDDNDASNNHHHHKVLFVNCATSKSMSSRAYGKQPIILEL